MSDLEVLAAQNGEPDILVSPYAPGWRVAAMQLPGVGTVSGKGPTGEAARISCLAEAAEILSLLARPDDRSFQGVDPHSEMQREFTPPEVAIINLSDPRDLGTEGAAAGQTWDAAARGALLERIERHAVARWLTAEVQAKLLPETWYGSDIAENTLERARTGSQTLRQTRFLVLEPLGPVWTIVALSQFADGGAPITGAAASEKVDEAVLGAISEMLQMECSFALARIAKQMGKETATHEKLFRRIASLESKATLWQPSQTQEFHGPSKPLGLRELAPSGAWLVDITREDIRIPVVRCVAPKLRSARVLQKFNQG
ncbi:MAG: YcaO-like family protein [Pseudomonadota bacterium]